MCSLGLRAHSLSIGWATETKVERPMEHRRAQGSPRPAAHRRTRRRQRTSKTLSLVELQYRALTPGHCCFSSAASVGCCPWAVKAGMRDQDRRPAIARHPKVEILFGKTHRTPTALTSSPNDALWPIAAKRSARPQTCNGLPRPIFPSRGTHFRKRSRLLGRGAILAATSAAPDGFRSYRPVSQTLITESPPLRIMSYGATRYDQRRGSPFRLQLLRSVAPLSPHSPSLPAFLGFPPPDVP